MTLREHSTQHGVSIDGPRDAVEQPLGGGRVGPERRTQLVGGRLRVAHVKSDQIGAWLVATSSGRGMSLRFAWRWNPQPSPSYLCVCVRVAFVDLEVQWQIRFV